MRGFAVLPGPDPVRPVQQATVVDPGQTVRQFKAFTGVAIPEVAPDRLRLGTGKALYLVVDAPAQTVRCEGRIGGQRTHRIAHDRPSELCGKFDGDVGGDAHFPGEFEHKPSAQGRVRNHNSLPVEGIERVAAQFVREPPGERFQAIAGVDLDGHHPFSGKRREV